jgi:hypothetical protein
MDAGLLNSSLIQEAMRLQFLAEAFNLFNFSNIALYRRYDYSNSRVQLWVGYSSKLPDRRSRSWIQATADGQQ